MQVLRAFAALLVVVHHAQSEIAGLAARSGAAFAPSLALPWPAGVDIFFVISGFIIVHAAAPLYGRPGGRTRFLAHRVARLVPLYWAVSALYLAVALLQPGVLGGEGGRPGAATVAASFLFWPALRADGAIQPLYGLGWTLNYEMFFYALFALGLGAARRTAVAGVIVALAALVILGAAVPGLPTPLAFWTDPIVLEFGLGAALGLARAERLRLPGAIRLAVAAAGLAGLALAPPEPGLRALAWGLPAAALVAAAVLGRDRAGPPALRRVERWAGRLGDASYALYLVHPFVLRGLREIGLRTGLAPLVPPSLGLAAMVALSLAAALVVHTRVERPLTARVRRRLDPGIP